MPASELDVRSYTGTQEKADREVQPGEAGHVILKQHGSQKPVVVVRQPVRKGKLDAFKNMKGREMLLFLAWKGVPLFQALKQKETTEGENYYHCLASGKTGVYRKDSASW